MTTTKITIKSTEEFVAWKHEWLSDAHTAEEFMQLSIRMYFDYSLLPLFYLNKGVLTPCTHATEVIDLVNEMSQRYGAFVSGEGYSYGINERREEGWFKHYPDVAGVVIARCQLWKALPSIISDTKIPCVRYDGKELKSEEIAKEMSDIIKYMKTFPDRVIDIDIPIFSHDLARLLKSLPKLKAATIKISPSGDIPMFINEVARIVESLPARNEVTIKIKSPENVSSNKSTGMTIWLM